MGLSGGAWTRHPRVMDDPQIQFRIGLPWHIVLRNAERSGGAMSDIPISDDEQRLNLREKLVHIDQMLADIDRTFADRDRKRQELRLAPWQLAFTGIATGAGLTVGAAAILRLIGFH